MKNIDKLFAVLNKETNKISIYRYITYEISLILGVSIRTAQRKLTEKEIINTDKHTIYVTYDIDMGNRGGKREPSNKYEY
jgi:hypothetical protein